MVLWRERVCCKEIEEFDFARECEDNLVGMSGIAINTKSGAIKKITLVNKY